MHKRLEETYQGCTRIFMSTISIDFETYFSKKLRYGLKTMIAEQYCGNALFDAYMVSVSDGKNSWAGHPSKLNWNILEGKTLLSHNRYFDSTVYAELVKRGLAPKVIYANWHCTADLSAYLCNRRALDNACEHLLGVKVSKESRSNADGKSWPKDFSAAEQAAMIEYARKDATLCWTLWNKFSDRWPAHERFLSDQTIRQGQRGVQINTRLLDDYLVQSHEMKLNTEKLLPWLSDDESEDWEDFDVKPTATKCIAEQCRRSGIPCPPIKAHEGEEAYIEWEETYGKTHPWIGALSSWRSINKLYGTFSKMKSRLRPDGTMPFALKYAGTHTLRWSGEAGINFQNFRKDPVLCNEQGLMETNEKRIRAAIGEFHETGKLPGWVKYAIDIRHLITPRPGKRMILSDLSQIEPRVLAHLAGDKAKLSLVRGGMSIYEAQARLSMGFTGEGKLDKKSMVYAESKARELALGYGAGWEKFIAMAAQYTGVDITADDPEFILSENGEQISGYGQRSRSIVEAYRKQNPKIADKESGIWAKLEIGLRRSVGGDFTVKLPSGRTMRYEHVRCERRIEPDEDGKPRSRSVFTAGIGGRRVVTYGGKLTENITQAVARDVFGVHLAQFGDSVLFSSHDEAIIETDLDNGLTVDDVAAVMSKAPEWMKDLPVAAEAKEAPHYLK